MKRRKVLGANYCRTCNNFGDKLTVPLLAQLSGVHAVWAPPKKAHLIGVGSILVRNNGRPRVPSGYKGIILGSGMMFDVPGPDLRHADVLIIRGPLSAAACSLDVDSVPYGDAGLIAPVLDDRPNYKPNAGAPLVVPHVIDHTLADAWPDAVFVDLRGNLRAIIQQYRGAASVVTSSLHGLILADALGIPRLHVPHGSVHGEGHKFRDYAASLDQPLENDFQLAPPERIAELQANIHRAFRLLDWRRTKTVTI